MKYYILSEYGLVSLHRSSDQRKHLTQQQSRQQCSMKQIQSALRLSGLQLLLAMAPAPNAETIRVRIMEIMQ